MSLAATAEGAPSVYASAFPVPVAVRACCENRRALLACPSLLTGPVPRLCAMMGSLLVWFSQLLCVVCPVLPVRAATDTVRCMKFLLCAAVPSYTNALASCCF